MLASYPILATWVHDDPVIVFLTIDGELIETTPEHPFYTADGDWVAAGDLQAGDHIQQADGTTGTVEAINIVYRLQPMYNLTVATAHTYFVGDGQWLVHNNCGFAPGTAKSALVPERLQHASRHLRPPESNILPNWSGKNDGQDFVDLAIPILENPLHTFNHTLGGTPVRGFAGRVQGQWVTIFIFKQGPNAGKVASSYVPSPQQIVNWGLK